MSLSRDIPALLQFLEQRSPVPFAWGNAGNDCVAFTAGAIEAQLGMDPLAGLAWTTVSEARRLLRREGGMRNAVDRRFQRLAPAMAQRGDVAGVACHQFGTRLMIVEGATLVGPAEKGLKRMPREAMLVAWDVLSLRSAYFQTVKAG